MSDSLIHKMTDTTLFLTTMMGKKLQNELRIDVQVIKILKPKSAKI